MLPRAYYWAYFLILFCSSSWGPNPVSTIPSWPPEWGSCRGVPVERPTPEILHKKQRPQLSKHTTSCFWTLDISGRHLHHSPFETPGLSNTFTSTKHHRPMPSFHIVHSSWWQAALGAARSESSLTVLFVQLVLEVRYGKYRDIVKTMSKTTKFIAIR